MQTRSHRRPAVRRRLAVAALVVAAPVVAGCGFDVQTDEIYQPAQGANARAESVDVLGAVVVSDTDGTGRLIATLVDKGNKGDRLTAVQGAGVRVSSPSDNISIPANNVGFANLADDQYAPIIVGGDAIEAGGYVRMRFSYASSEPTTVNVPVVDAQGTYSGLAPGQSATSDSATGPTNDVAAQGSQGAFPAPGGAS